MFVWVSGKDRVSAMGDNDCTLNVAKESKASEQKHARKPSPTVGLK